MASCRNSNCRSQAVRRPLAAEVSSCEDAQPMPSLAGIKVFELGSGFPLWHAGRVLQRLGATVIRIEPPDGIAVLAEEQDSYAVLNGLKDVLVANLREQAGRDLLRGELAAGDVILVGVRPATAAKW